MKSKAIRKPSETGETSKWLALKRETSVLELEVLHEKQKLAQQARQEIKNFTPNEDKLQVTPESSNTFASLQSQVPSLSSLKKQEKQQKLDWPQDFVSGMPPFDKLDIAKFVSGYLEMISTYDSLVKNSMYDFLKLLMDKAIYYS